MRRIVGNTWRRLHGIPMFHTKRWKHERKDIPKGIRIQYHARLKAGCSKESIDKFLNRSLVKYAIRNKTCNHSKKNIIA